MTKEVDELKARIGKKKFEEIEALAREQKKKGKSPEEIVAAIRKKFSKVVPATGDLSHIIPSPR